MGEAHPVGVLPLLAPLFVPSNRPERFAKAAIYGAGTIIVDLEDAVALADKISARENLTALRNVPASVFVRINGEGTPWFADDLKALREANIRQVCVPKVDSRRVLDAVHEALGQDVRILPLIETASGVRNAAEIAAYPSVFQLGFGPADFFMDMGCAASPEFAAHVLTTLAIASRAAGIALPLDGPCFSISDPEAVATECASARANGAGGKLCIHPSQVGQVMQAFLPSETEVAWARRVVEADRGGAAQMLDGKMIDAPIVARARRLLEISECFGG